MDRARIGMIIELLHLTPYQAYMLEQHGHKYDLDRVHKKGQIMCAPYKSNSCYGLRDCYHRVFHGPRVDLIGADRVLVCDQRGVKLYSGGLYHARDDQGDIYYADHMGNKLSKMEFVKGSGK